MKEEFSAIDCEMVPEGPVADLAICKSETVTLEAKLLQTYRNNSQLWKIHLSAIATFRFYGLELLDEQGLHVLFSLRPCSAFAGGEGPVIPWNAFFREPTHVCRLEFFT